MGDVEFLPVGYSFSFDHMEAMADAARLTGISAEQMGRSAKALAAAMDRHLVDVIMGEPPVAVVPAPNPIEDNELYGVWG